MRLTIKIPSQSDLEVVCRPSDPVAYLKEKIFQSRGFFSGFYKLFFNDQELCDFQRVQDFGIMDGSVIEMIHWNQVPFSTEEKFFRLVWWKETAKWIVILCLHQLCCCFCARDEMKINKTFFLCITNRGERFLWIVRKFLTDDRRREIAFNFFLFFSLFILIANCVTLNFFFLSA